MKLEKGAFLLIDKPKDWTSFDVVNVVRKNARQSHCHPEHIRSAQCKLREGSLKQSERDSSTSPQNDSCRKTSKLRVGHAGTLDPFATGLLIVGVGREATKRLDEFKNLPKTYVATVRLGAVSDTDDPTGVITPFSVIPTEAEGSLRERRSDSSTHPPTDGFARNDKLNVAIIKKTLKKFVGEQTQVPPMYSAKKINGQILYKLARAGQTVERQPQKINIYEIKFLEYAWPDLKIEVTCSAGTYIRTLARDIGDALGTGAYCADLRRTKIGEYEVEDASEMAIFDKKTKI